MTTSWATLAALAAKGEIRLHLDLASILGYILIGLVVGLVARFIVPGRDPIGLLGTLLIGVIGAVIGGWLAGGGFAGTAGVGWIASVLGAGLLGRLLIGVIGAVIGGWLAGEVFAETAGVDWIASILVAALLVLLLRAGSRGRGTSGRWELRPSGL